MANPNSSAQRSFAAEPYDSVAAVLASKQITADLVGRRVHTKDGGAFDVVDAGEVSSAGGAGLNPLPRTGVIDARLFGVTGDGITDDTAAVKKALAYMKEAGKGASLEIYIPGSPVIKESIDFSGQFSVRMDGYPAGFKVDPSVFEAVTFGKQSLYTGRLVRLCVIGPTYDPDNPNLGVVLYNVTGVQADSIDVRLFHYPMQIAPRSGERVGYSTFINASLVGGVKNLTCNLTGTGWSNELVFIGGRFTHAAHTEHHVYLDDPMNHIRFAYVSCEGSGKSALYFDGAGVYKSHSIVVDQCRTEGTWTEGTVVFGVNVVRSEVRSWNFYVDVRDSGELNRIVTPYGESFSTAGTKSALKITRTGSISGDNALLELRDDYTSSGTPRGIRYITARATGWLAKLGSTSKDILSVSLPTVTQGFLEFFGSSRFVRDSSTRTSGALLIEDQFSSSGDVNVIEVKTGRNVGKVLSGSLISTGQVSGAINLVNNSFQFESRSGAWQSPPLKLGSYQLWVDAGGLLRIKNGSPTSDTDGTVVGTQA